MKSQAKKDDVETLELDGYQVQVTHPDKPYFTQEAQLSKLDLVRYYLAVAPGALRGMADRPLVLKRFVGGAHAEPFYQKRAPSERPSWLRTVTLNFPSGRTAEEVVIENTAGLIWTVNMGSFELHPHPVRAADLDHPDELRIDLDPGPGVPWESVRAVAAEARSVLEEAGLQGWPKTSGSRGMHINVRIQPLWSFTEVRRAALALARAVERRAPSLATSKWWKEERHGVFLDYNQNAKDRTTCSAYSIRPLPDARVSTPLDWDEVPLCNPSDFTVATVPARFAALGDPHSAIDRNPGSLEALLALADRDEADGLGDAPWPPHFRKMEGEAPRVSPSRARSAAKKAAPAKAGTTHSEGEQTAGGNTITPAGGEAAQAPVTRAPRAGTMPLLTISHSPDRKAALAGLERWKLRHPEAAALLAIDDILIDRMRGSAYVWTRIRVNLRHVPKAARPPQQTPDPDDDPTRGNPTKPRTRKPQA